MKPIYTLLAAMMFSLPMVACDMDEGPVEETGEQIDEAADETGEALDEAADDAEETWEDTTNE